MLLDYFETTPLSDTYILRKHPSSDTSISARGQTFKLSLSYKLTSVKFKLRRSSLAPTGTLRAYLYAHTGTWGSTGEPTGEPLTISLTAIDMSTMATSYTWYEFVFDGSFTLAQDTPYCIAVYSLDGFLDGEHFIRIASNLSGGHVGNGFYYNASVNWDWHSSRDFYFYLYGEIPSLSVQLIETLRLQPYFILEGFNVLGQRGNAFTLLQKLGARILRRGQQENG